MAETLRELVVSLSLQSDNFSRNIQSVQKQIKEAESRFQAAGAGVDNFANKTDGLNAKAGMLTDKLRMQSQVVGQYEKYLAAANATLQRNMQTQQQNTAKLAMAKKAQTDLGEAVKRGEATYKKYATQFGETNARTVAAKNALDALKKKHTEASDEVKKLEGQVDAQSKAMQRNADQIVGIETALNKAKAAEAATKAELDKTTRAIETNRAKWEAAAASMEKFGKRATTAGQNLARAGKSLMTYVTAPLMALGGYAVKASIDAESAFAGVRKTVDMTEAEFARLDDTITQMSTSKPASYSDIAGLAETGGQLGIANENLETFISTMTDLGVATNLVGQEGAAQMAKFANVTGMSQENFDRMGAAIVDLGNNMATTEADIMEMSMRLGAAGSQVGLSEAQILGFAAALSSVGIEAQAGGSAFSKAMIGMELAVVTGKNGLKDYAKVAGMSSKEFQKAWKDDAAGAMQAFIVGLSKMDEEGISTIKVLDDMGFSEVRLRDTLMRATNASGLFADAQKISSTAWRENTALTNEASKRYDTTESRLTMLKNRTTALARTLGDDLSPAFGDIIDRAGEWLDSLSQMDAGQRQSMLTTAAWLAAIGPGIMLIGKMNTGLGNLATGFSGLIDASVKAGGGLKGLFAATGSLLGPAGIAVLTVAAIAGAAAWYDWASGAKAAREAGEAMMKTADEWKNTQAKTIFDTGNDPLGRFGLSKENFSGGQTELEDWLSRLTETWSDGKKETGEIVKGYVDEFKGGSDKIRDAIKKRQDTQKKYGVTGDKTTEDDLKKLKAYDKEVEALLKKRKNGKLTEDDQKRLEQIISERVELQLKYTTGEGGSYESLAAAVEAEKARLKLDGDQGGETTALYGDALTGAAQGYQTQVDAINQSYRDQYADIMAITDEKEREAALTQLNTEHTLALKKAQEEYNAVVGKYAPEAFRTPEVQDAADDMELLKQKLAELKSGEISATAFEEFTKTLDEGKLASYLALLKQLQGGGEGDRDLGDGNTANKLLEGYKALDTYLKDHPGLLTGLGGMLGAAGDEANRVLVDMALTPEGQTLKDWLDNNKGFSLNGTLTGLPESVTIDATAPVTLTNIPDAITVDATSPVTLTDVPDSLTVEADAPVTITGLPDGPLTIPANSPTTLTDLPESITVQCDAPVGLSDIPGSITVQADAPVTLTNIPADVGIPSATIQSVKYADGIEVAAPNIPDVTIKAQLAYSDFSGIGKAAIDAYFAANPGEKPSVMTNVGFQTKWATDLKDAYDEGILSVWKNGAKLELTPDVIGEIGPKDVWAKGFDENGNPTLDIILLPKTQEAAHEAEAAMQQKPENFLPDKWKTSTDDKVDSINSLAQGVKDLAGAGEDLMSQQGKAVLVDQLVNLANNADGLNSISAIADSLGTALEALNSGELSDEDAAKFQERVDGILSLVRTADQYLGVGNDISAGIASGMKAYGWSGDASTLATSIDTALRTATGSHSPATKYVPIGVSIAEGVAKGITNGTYKVENALVAMARKALAKAKAELNISSPSRVMRDEVGVMMVRGAAVGIEEETDRQQKAVANAFRALVQPALAGAQGGVTTNSRVYHQNSTVSLAGANIVVRDQQDIRALALELNSLQIAQQRALGRVTR